MSPKRKSKDYIQKGTGTSRFLLIRGHNTMMKIGTIIIAIIGVLMLFDTKLFYYASMSQYFLFCIAAIILFVIGLIRFLNNPLHTFFGN